MQQATKNLACVASVSVRFRRKERRTRVKDREKSGSRFISRAVKTESPRPRYFFALKPNGNACYAGYKLQATIFWKVTYRRQLSHQGS